MSLFFEVNDEVSYNENEEKIEIEQIQESFYLLVIGDEGSGKSTLMAKLVESYFVSYIYLI